MVVSKNISFELECARSLEKLGDMFECTIFWITDQCPNPKQ